MTKKLACLVALLALAGCPDEGGSSSKPGADTSAVTTETSAATDTSSATPRAPDISQLKVGQRYVFDVVSGTLRAKEVWRVEQVTPTAVKYTTANLIERDGATVQLNTPAPSRTTRSAPRRPRTRATRWSRPPAARG